jgi:hypothetical protein
VLHCSVGWLPLGRCPGLQDLQSLGDPRLQDVRVLGIPGCRTCRAANPALDDCIIGSAKAQESQRYDRAGTERGLLRNYSRSEWGSGKAPRANPCGRKQGRARLARESKLSPALQSGRMPKICVVAFRLRELQVTRQFQGLKVISQIPDFEVAR